MRCSPSSIVSRGTWRSHASCDTLTSSSGKYAVRFAPRPNCFFCFLPFAAFAKPLRQLRPGNDGSRCSHACEPVAAAGRHLPAHGQPTSPRRKTAGTVAHRHSEVASAGARTRRGRSRPAPRSAVLRIVACIAS